MDSDSSLSSPPSSDDESAPPVPVVTKTLTLKGGKLGGSSGPAPRPRKRQIPPARLSPSPSPEREQSPPHDYVLADNPDIAVSNATPLPDERVISARADTFIHRLSSCSAPDLPKFSIRTYRTWDLKISSLAWSGRNQASRSSNIYVHYLAWL